MTVRGGYERHRNSDGSNRIGSGRNEYCRKADNKRERAEDDVQNQVDVVSPDPANRLGLHNHRWPIRDRRPDRRRNGHRTKGAPQSIKVSLKLRPTWERSRRSLDVEPSRLLPLGPTATRKERLFNDFESRRRDVELAEFSHLDEPGVLGVAPGMRLSLDVGTKDIHENVVPMDSFAFFLDEVRHSNHLDGSHLDLGLLAGLSDHGSLHRFSQLHRPPGDAPPTLIRSASPTNEEDLGSTEHDRTDRGHGTLRELGRRHSPARRKHLL